MGVSVVVVGVVDTLSEILVNVGVVGDVVDPRLVLLGIGQFPIHQ